MAPARHAAVRPDGIVLAGGRGARMGRPKALIMFGEKTLAENAVALLHTRCARVVVVARPEVPLSVPPATVVMDRPGPRGPLTALATGLAATAADDVLVLACDLPFAGPMLDALRALPPGRAAVGVDADGHIQPLCARYPRLRALATIEELIAAGDLRARAAAAALAAHRVDDRWGALANLNTAADLERAVARLSLNPSEIRG